MSRSVYGRSFVGGGVGVGVGVGVGGEDVEEFACPSFSFSFSFSSALAAVIVVLLRLRAPVRDTGGFCARQETYAARWRCGTVRFEAIHEFCFWGLLTRQDETRRDETRCEHEVPTS